MRLADARPACNAVRAGYDQVYVHLPPYAGEQFLHGEYASPAYNLAYIENSYAHRYKVQETGVSFKPDRIPPAVYCLS